MTPTFDHVNDWLDRLERMERDLSSPVRGESLAEEFEEVHRVALRSAGIAVERANAERKRPLPLNVWRSLDRLGPVQKARAAETAEFVALRQRAEATASGARSITRDAVDRHRAGTLAYIRAMHAEIMSSVAMAA